MNGQLSEHIPEAEKQERKQINGVRHGFEMSAVYNEADDRIKPQLSFQHRRFMLHSILPENIHKRVSRRGVGCARSAVNLVCATEIQTKALAVFIIL